MTDFFIVEEIQKMIKAIPRPRLLFKKGVTVRGYFRPYMSLKDYTKAVIFKDHDEITPVTVRFSSMLGDKGTADTRRNIKGMAVKFHSHDQVYDMICQNIPVLMGNDINKLSDMFNIFYIKEHFDGIDSEKLWEYADKNNECLPFALMLYSSMGLSDSFVNINMYSVNTYRWMNNNSRAHLVRYKWVPAGDSPKKIKAADKPMTVNAAEFIAGYDPDRAVNEIISSILNKRFPAFELHVQMLSGNAAADERSTDKTLMWSEKNAPYMCTGIMVLDQIDETEIDDASLYFLPGTTIDGIELWRDEMSQIMDFIYRTEAIERGNYL